MDPRILRLAGELVFEVFRGKLNVSDARELFREETGLDIVVVLSELEDFYEARAPHCAEIVTVFNQSGPRITLRPREVKRCVELLSPDSGRD